MNICSGIPGGQVHKVTAVLEAGEICSECEISLFSTRAWGSASPSELKGKGKGSGIIINHAKHVPKPRLRGEPKTKRRQPWQMEKP